MRADEGLTIEPNAELQQRLHGLTSKEVLEAKDASGRLLLQGSPGERQQNADAIAGISNRAMSLGTPGTEAALGALYIDPESAGPGLRYHQGFLGIDWGDLWESIRNGVGKIFDGLKEVVVTTIIDSVTKVVNENKVVFHLVIDGIKYPVAGGMDDLEQRVKKAMDQFASSLAPDETFEGYMDKDLTPDRRKNARSSASHNVMLDSFRESYQRAEDDGALAGLVEATGPLDELLDQLAALADTFQLGDGKQAFDDGVKYFSDIATSPDKVVNLVLAALSAASMLANAVLTAIAVA